VVVVVHHVDVMTEFGMEMKPMWIVEGNCPKCEDGKSCLIDDDCISDYCYNGICRTPSCYDGIKNQGEEDIDCGGPCLPCHCFDGIQNFNETGVDCGGECPKCRKIKRIVNRTVGNETIAVVLIENVTPLCFNKRLDKGETDVDCEEIVQSVKTERVV